MADLTGFADLDALILRAQRAWKPPPRLSLSEWADKNYYLSPESAAEPGRWKCIPYQRGILDAMTDPLTEYVTVEKSGRVGFTKCVNILVAYHIAQDPCPMMVVQPTIEDARGYSKEELSVLIRDVPAVAAIMPPLKARDSGRTILHKTFPGGSISVVGANSGRGFRRVSRKVVLFDEVDGYPPGGAGREGDQIRLGIQRTAYYWDRKIVSGSTPTIAGYSRIDEMFHDGDRRHYYVPCPHCGHMDILVFREGERGHFMVWPEGKPGSAHFVCRKNGCVIEHKHKRDMVAAGEWRADAPFAGHASFRIWAAYSYAPSTAWGQLAIEFTKANKGGAEQLKTFVNTTLGETWVERGEAPPWEALYRRREQYQAPVPKDTVLVTAGVDVQRDRLVYEVVAWLADKSSYSVDQGSIPGDTAGEEPWKRLDELLNQTWTGEDGAQHSIRMLAADAGDQTQVVYGWCRRWPLSRVIAVKGSSSAKTLISSPSAVDVTVSGRKLSRGYRVWPVGVSIAKSELYGWLRLEVPTKAGEPLPPGFCHFPDSYGEEFFKELTAEQLVPIVKKGGYTVHEWSLIPNRENHALDARIYARCAAALCGLDRYAAQARAKTAAPAVPAVTSKPATQPRAGRESEPAPEPTRKLPREGGWLGNPRGRGSRGRGSWIPRR